MSKDITKKLDEKIQEDSNLKIADNTDFNQLYVVKGKAGIFLLKVMKDSTNQYKNNIIPLIEWKTLFNPDSKTHSILSKNIISLANFAFYTTDKEIIQVPVLDKDGKFIEKKIETTEESEKEFETEDKEIDLVLSIKDLFNNLNEYENLLDDNISVEDLDLSNVDTVLSLMDISVPNFDPEKFKPYHLTKAIKYYVWFKEALLEFNAFSEKIKKGNKS